MSRLWNIAIVGATGEVGKAIVAGLEEAGLPLGKVHALASAGSTEETLMLKTRPLLVADLAEFDFALVDVAVFAVPAEVAEVYVPKALASGCRVIDHSSAFRFSSNASLVVAGHNIDRLGDDQQLLACADASAAILTPILAAIERRAGLSRVQLTILRAASARGKAGLGELARQTGELLNARGIEATAYPQQLAFNLLPLLGTVDADGLTADEAAIAAELRELLGQPELAIDVSCISVPVFYGHATTLHVETVEYLDAAEAAGLLAALEGVELQAEADELTIATPVGSAEQGERIHVGRVRGVASPGLGVQAWVLADNVRAGAAVQSLKILEKVMGSSKKSL